MPNYYILGAKRLINGKYWENRSRDMVQQQLLEVGWGWKHPSFAHLYGKPEAEIVSTLKKLGEPSGSYTAHKLFLNLRPGDFVAIKEHSEPHGKTPVLMINGFACVAQRNGTVYRRGKAPLSHCICADFLKHGEKYEFQIGGYGRTIHRLTNPRHIRQIFAPLFGRKINLPPSPQNRKGWQRKAAILTTIEKQMRTTRERTIIINQRHKRMQIRLFKHLAEIHGKKNVDMELDSVDIQVRERKQLTLYEIKPYRSPLLCVRDALGQILSYAWREDASDNRRVRLVVVGPNRATKDDLQFIDFIKNSLRVEFDYLAFQ